MKCRPPRALPSEALALKARLFTDGGARGNPGPAAYGYVLEAEDGTVLASEGQAIGSATNNVAEYSGLIAGLRKASSYRCPRSRSSPTRADGQADARRVPGEERGAARALARGAVLARQLGNVEYRHVKRAHNELADQLVNEALDAA